MEQLLTKNKKKLVKLEALRKDFITNIILIFNSFFEYGFINKKSEQELPEISGNQTSDSHSQDR